MKIAESEIFLDNFVSPAFVFLSKSSDYITHNAT